MEVGGSCAAQDLLIHLFEICFKRRSVLHKDVTTDLKYNLPSNPETASKQRTLERAVPPHPHRTILQTHQFFTINAAAQCYIHRIYMILRNFTAVASSLKSMIINVYVKLRNSAAPTYCPVVVIVVEVIVWVSGRQYLSSSAQKPSENHQNPTIDPTIAGLFGETQSFIKCQHFFGDSRSLRSK